MDLVECCARRRVDARAAARPLDSTQGLEGLQPGGWPGPRHVRPAGGLLRPGHVISHRSRRLAPSVVGPAARARRKLDRRLGGIPVGAGDRKSGWLYRGWDGHRGHGARARVARYARLLASGVPRGAGPDRDASCHDGRGAPCPLSRRGAGLPDGESGQHVHVGANGKEREGIGAEVQRRDGLEPVPRGQRRDDQAVDGQRAEPEGAEHAEVHVEAAHAGSVLLVVAALDAPDEPAEQQHAHHREHARRGRLVRVVRVGGVALRDLHGEDDAVDGAQHHRRDALQDLGLALELVTRDHPALGDDEQRRGHRHLQGVKVQDAKKQNAGCGMWHAGCGMWGVGCRVQDVPCSRTP
eukprot:scaffold61871_cov65-Phaeocystis_antarctica.AAC.3